MLGVTIPEEQERIENDRKMQFQEKASKYKAGVEKCHQILKKYVEISDDNEVEMK